MPYRICKTIEVESGHMLSKHPDKCRFPHGHTRKVEIVLEAEELDVSDMVCDFKVIREALGDFLASLDHAMCMNTEDPAFAEFKQRYGERIIGFPGQDPTTEAMARMIYEEATSRLRDYRDSGGGRFPLRTEVRIVSVKAWETASSWAEYFPSK